MQMRMEKRGSGHTLTHYNLLGPFFFGFALIPKRVRGRTGKALRKVTGVFLGFLFLSLLLALPFFYLIFERWCVLLGSYIYVYIAYFFLPLERKKAREGKEIECDNSNIFQLKKYFFSPATCFSPKTLARTDDYPERRSNLDLLYVACVLRTRVQYVCYVD